MSEGDVIMAFRLIDRDSSKTITIDEFGKYYKRCTMERSVICVKGISNYGYEGGIQLSIRIDRFAISDVVKSDVWFTQSIIFPN